MDVYRYSKLPIDNEAVWEALGRGELNGVYFGHNEKYGSMEYFLILTGKMKPRSILEMAVALSLDFGPWYWIDEKIIDEIVDAFRNKTITGPFEELGETFGYPIFRDQVASILMSNLKLDESEAYELTNGLFRKRKSALEDLYSQSWMENDKNLFLWKYTPAVNEREWMVHISKLIYEAGWIVYNGPVKQYFTRNPIWLY